jgi:hypothetical protein
MKLGVIVPYRKRPGHLRKFRESIESYLKDQDYELIVVEQNDDLPFNRGKLLNIGFQQAIRNQCDYVVFHDIDMLPIDVDYSYSDVPIHLANNFTNSKREIFKTYFGGVTLFPIDLFKKVNGYSNEYWGWGFEDDDLLMRLTEQNVFTDFEIYEVPKESTSGLYLHGDKSYVEFDNTIDITKDFTLHITFKPDDIIPDYDKDFDEYCVFSIPGWDTTIGYNSFNRYKFETWDIGKECHQITSDYSYPKLTQITITYNKDDRLLIMYQDGQEVGSKKIVRKILDTKKEKFYIGIAALDREHDRKSFRGFVSNFAYWDKTLQKNEIKEFHDTLGMGLLCDNNQYNSSENLKLYYDFKFIMLDNSYNYEKGKVVNFVNPKQFGTTYNSIPKSQNELEQKRISIPARRNSTFEMIKHKPEGYLEGGWKSESTRLNQIRFYNQVINNESNLTQDGLSTLKYTKVSSTSQGKYSFISVKL